MNLYDSVRSAIENMSHKTAVSIGDAAGIKAPTVRKMRYGLGKNPSVHTVLGLATVMLQLGIIKAEIKSDKTVNFIDLTQKKT